METVLRELEAERLEKARVAQELEKTREECARLRKLLIEMHQQRFQSGRSEQMDPRQLEMLLGGEGREVVAQEQSALPVEKPDKPSEQKTPRCIRLPEHTRTIETVIDPEEVTQQPHMWKRIG